MPPPPGNAALVAEAAGDTLRAAALYARATAHPRRSGCARRAVQRRAVCLRYRAQAPGRPDGAGLQLPEVRLEAWLLLAGEAMKEGRYSEADSLLQSAEGMAAGDERVQTARALWEVLAGDRTRGREPLLRLWLADGGQAQAANLLAVLYADLTGAPLRVTDYHHLAGRQAMFAWPVRTHDISSAFGWRPSPRGDDWQQRLRTLEFHFGIDIPGSVGDEVWAAEGGTVVASAYEGDGREEVEILHEGGYTTLYCHLSRRLVQAGQRVERGAGHRVLGSTGNSTGPHLHFGVYNENKRR
jgi:murein DD-endopeptidase MepM/ murein hydrolase activator NlpD